MADKLTKNEPVRLVLVYETGHTVEFNVKSLVSLVTSIEDMKTTKPAKRTLEIVLEYDEAIKYNQLEDKKRLREAAFDLTPL